MKRKQKINSKILTHNPDSQTLSQPLHGFTVYKVFLAKLLQN